MRKSSNTTVLGIGKFDRILNQKFHSDLYSKQGSSFTFSEHLNGGTLTRVSVGIFEMYADGQIRQILEDLVQTSCFKLGLNPNDFPVKHMGLVKQKGDYKHGWYMEIQNFDNLHMVKQSQNDRFWRYTFRSVMFSDEVKPTLMVMKWTPSMGSVEDNENIYQKKYETGNQEFLQLMVSTMMNLNK